MSKTETHLTVTKFNITKLNRNPCRGCGKEFVIGEVIVSISVKHHYGPVNIKHYHMNHFVDAHGDPIYD